MKNKSWEIK